MIVGIGHDLVHVPRIARLVRRWGDTFLNRLFTPEERAYCARFADPAPHLAARFAAKEAFYKALSRGRPLALGFRDVGVSQSGGLELTDRAQRLCADAGVTATHLSLTHEREYAAAFVILEHAD